MTKFILRGSIMLLVGVTTLLASCCLALETRADPQAPSTAVQKKDKVVGLDEKCGTLDDLALRVEVCAKPLMDILQGTLTSWPKDEAGADALCNDFAGSERCIREAARQCAKGIHRTIISTLATSMQRIRKRECTPKSKLPAIVSLTNCLEKHQDAMGAFMANATGRLEAIEKQTPNADKRLMNVCCMITDIELEIRRTLNPFCPAQADHSIRMYRSVLEDVMELICRNPKCKDYMKGYKHKPNKNFAGMIAIILRIVFSLELD